MDALGNAAFELPDDCAQVILLANSLPDLPACIN